MIQGASSIIEIDEYQEVTLDTIREALLSVVPYPWHISNTHYPEKDVLANKINPVVIYFQTGSGCVFLEDYNTKKHSLVDLLPDFTADQVAALINKQLKRIGA